MQSQMLINYENCSPLKGATTRLGDQIESSKEEDVEFIVCSEGTYCPLLCKLPLHWGLSCRHWMYPAFVGNSKSQISERANSKAPCIGEGRQQNLAAGPCSKNVPPLHLHPFFPNHLSFIGQERRPGSKAHIAEKAGSIAKVVEKAGSKVGKEVR